jgi:hypothetical protein
LNDFDGNLILTQGALVNSTDADITVTCPDDTTAALARDGGKLSRGVTGEPGNGCCFCCDAGAGVFGLLALCAMAMIKKRA